MKTLKDVGNGMEFIYKMKKLKIKMKRKSNYNFCTKMKNSSTNMYMNIISIRLTKNKFNKNRYYKNLNRNK